jgi:hypothetical protein
MRRYDKDLAGKKKTAGGMLMGMLNSAGDDDEFVVEMTLRAIVMRALVRFFWLSCNWERKYPNVIYLLATVIYVWSLTRAIRLSEGENKTKINKNKQA